MPTDKRMGCCLVRMIAFALAVPQPFTTMVAASGANNTESSESASD